MAFTTEGDLDTQGPQEGLRAAQGAGERPGTFGSAGAGARGTAPAAIGADTEKVGGTTCPRAALGHEVAHASGALHWPRAWMRVGPRAPLAAQAPGRQRMRAILQTRFCPRRERLAHRLRFTRDDTQVGACCSIGLVASLLPITDRSNRNTERGRELLL